MRPAAGKFNLSSYSTANFTYDGTYWRYTGGSYESAQLIVQAGQISSKVETSDYNGNTIASYINQDATTIKLKASKLEFDGTASFVKDIQESIDVGGRNILIGTTESKELTTAANQNYFNPQLYKLSSYGAEAIKSIDNTYITISFDYSITNVDTAFNMTASLHTGSGTYGAGFKVAEIPVGNSSGHAVGTRQITTAMRENAQNRGIMISGSGNANANAKVTISNVKLEFGNKATDWTAAPEDLKVGGRNLLQHSASLDSNSNYGITITRVEGDLYRAYGTSTASSIVYLGVYNMSPLLVSANGEFTLSIDREPVNGVGIYLNYRTGSSTDSIPGPWSNYGNNKVTFTGQEGHYFRYIGLAFQSGVTVDFTFHMKLEKGNKATDWTPAPEDVQAEIDAKKSIFTVNATGSDASQSYATIITWAEEGRQLTFSVDSTAGIKAGDTVRIKTVANNMGSGGTPVYVVTTCRETPTSATSIKTTSHGLDTTVIDGGHILTGTIDADRIGANSITAQKLAIGDFNNYITANENDEASLKTGNSGILVGGWITKSESQTNIWIRPITSNWVNQGDQYRVTGTVKLPAAGSVTVVIYGRNTDTTTSGYNSCTVKIAQANANKEVTFNGIISITNSDLIAAPRANIAIVFCTTDTWSSNYQIGYCKNMKCERMSGGSLIVDGAIQAEHIAANSINASKMRLGDFNNYITVTEKDQKSLSVNEAIENGWVHVTSSAIVRLSSPQPIWVSNGEKYRITGTVKAPAAGCVVFIVYGVNDDESGATGTYSNSVTVPIASANTETTVNTVLTINSSNLLSRPKSYVCILFCSTSTWTSSYQTGYFKNLKMERMSGGSLIVDGAITATKIAANSIGAMHMTISDSTNLATVNEQYAASIPTDFSDDFKATISGGYLVKKVATQQYLMLTDYTANSFAENDELYYEFYGKAATAGNITLNVWGYTGTPPTHTYSHGHGSSISLTTTEKFYSGTIKLSNANWKNVTTYLIGFSDTRDPKSQIYIKKAIVRRKSAGELIVDGAIQADHIAANSIGVSKIKIGEFAAGNKNYLAVIDNSKNGAAAVGANIKYGFNYTNGRYQVKAAADIAAGSFNQIYLQNPGDSYPVDELAGKQAIFAIDWGAINDSTFNDEWRVYIDFYDSNLTYIEGYSLYRTKISQTITLPSNVKYARTYLRITQNKLAVPSGTTLTIVGLRLTAGNVPQAWSLCPGDKYTDGDNMLKNSDNMTTADFYVSNGTYGTATWGVSMTPPGGKTVKGVRLTNTNISSNVGVAQTNANMRRHFARGVYTISAWVKGSADGTVMVFPFLYTDNNIPYIGGTFKVKKDYWTKVSWTAIHDGGHSGAASHAGGYVYYQGSANNDTCDICCIKVEAGTVASGWCPAESELAATATNYITRINEAGIQVHPENTTKNRVSVTGDGMYIYKNDVLQAHFIGTEVALGEANKNRVVINSSGMHVYNVIDSTTGQKEVALFGNTARVGRTDGPAFYMNASSLQAYYMNGSTRTKYFEVSPSGIMFGSKTQSDILNDNIKVGGTNLLKNSMLYKSGSHNGFSLAKSSAGDEYIYISGTSTGAVDLSLANLQSLTLTNTTITVSTNSVPSGIRFCVSTTKDGAWYKEYSPITYYSSTERRLTFTLENGETLRYLRVRTTESGVTANQSWRFKIEVGNKQTQWSPAPEDVAADISDAAKTATTYITNIDANGIWVTPSGKKPTNTSTGAGATGTRINGDGMQIFNAGVQVASYGSSVKIGRLTKNYLEITDSRINFCDGANSQVFGRINKGYEDRELVLGTFKDEYTYATLSIRGQNGQGAFTVQNGTSSSNKWGALTLTSTAWSLAVASYTSSAGTNYDATLQLTSSKLALYSNGVTDSNIKFSVVPSTGKLTIEGHSSPIGSILSTNGTKSIAKESSSYASTGISISLPAGSWAVTYSVSFPGNSTGNRAAVLYFNGTKITCSECKMPAVNTAERVLTGTMFVSHTSSSDQAATVYAWSTATSALTATIYMRAMRIA